MIGPSIVLALASVDVEMYLADGGLKFRAPSGVMDDDRRALVSEHRVAIIEHLQQLEAAAGMSPRDHLMGLADVDPVRGLVGLYGPAGVGELLALVAAWEEAQSYQLFEEGDRRAAYLAAWQRLEAARPALEPMPVPPSPVKATQGRIGGPEPCPCCRGEEWWRRSPDAPWVCLTCHPPGSPSIVRELQGDVNNPIVLRKLETKPAPAPAPAPTFIPPEGETPASHLAALGGYSGACRSARDLAHLLWDSARLWQRDQGTPAAERWERQYWRTWAIALEGGNR